MGFDSDIGQNGVSPGDGADQPKGLFGMLERG